MLPADSRMSISQVQSRDLVMARSELLELDWRNSFDSLSSAVDEPLPGSFRLASDWICRCPATELADLCVRMRKREDIISRLGIGNLLNELCPRDHLKPRALDQVVESCCRMTRKRMMKLIDLAQRLKRKLSSTEPSRLGQSLALHELLPYELELQTNNLNEFLATKLDQIARESLGKLYDFDEDELNDIPARIIVAASTERCRLQSRASSSSSWSSSAGSRPSLSSSLSGDSGISLIVQTSEPTTTPADYERRKLKTKSRICARLERHFELRSSRQFVEIVAFSWELFQELLHENPLLELELPNKPLTLNQLKVFARVECQKLRAKLRFHWLARCFCIAFDSDRPGGKIGAAKSLPPLQNNPKGLRPSSAFTCYLDGLARLMGDALRRHYLEEALDRFIFTLERHLARGADTKLSLTLELEPDGSESNQVMTSSRPEEQLKETLAFVMEEISWTCRELPRVECQQLSGPLDEASNLKILTSCDQLIEKKRHKMEQLVELLIGQHSVNPGTRNCSRMLDGSYLNLIDIVNKFRESPEGLGAANKQRIDEPAEGDETERDFGCEGMSLIGFEWLKIGSSDGEKLIQIEQLEATWHQINLLDRLEYELKCKLATGLTFGRLAALDLTKFNESLAKILHKERLLLVRVKSDELLRLLEAIRKQMDELELNIDLETAVEDYLEERQRARQSLQPNLERQILLDDVPRAEEAELDQVAADEAADGWDQTLEAPAAPVELEERATTSGVMDDRDEDEELLDALVNANNSRAGHQLFAETDVPAELLNASEAAQRHSQVAPLIESRLLLGRYKYLNNFLHNELDSFVAQLGFVLLRGVPFLCQFSWLQHWLINEGRSDELSRESSLEPEQLELLAEISWRAREFSLMLGDSLGRLAKAYTRLQSSMGVRATILNKNLIEFDWLMWKLAECRLESSSDEAANIKQLDLIQNTSAWSRKLNLRLEFLASQIELIQRESRLLLIECQRELSQIERFHSEACQLVAPLEAGEVAKMIATVEEESEWRREAISRWRTLASQIATFWSLAEEFETQQVKWLNSDGKRLDFRLIQSSFELRFQTRLDELRGQLLQGARGDEGKPFSEPAGAGLARKPEVILLDNIKELDARLAAFRRLCLPILRFLSNEHLNAEHWLRLQQILAEDHRLNEREPQVYTTVAQLLELGVTDELAKRLDLMSHEATIEHELSLLIQAEIRRQDERLSSRSSRQRLESELASMEALELLDTWNERELQLAAGRFIKTRWQLVRELNEDELALVEGLAGKLVACHLSVRRLIQLGGQLNLEPSPTESWPKGPLTTNRDQVERRRHKSGTLFVRSRLSGSSGQQRVGALLLVEFLRLFTESWIESEQRLSARAAKLDNSIRATRAHLAEIGHLLQEVDQIRASDSKLAIDRNELELSRLQQSSLRLELDRELLATSESSSLELQAEALRRRNECIKQISGRAIPAIRAASRALDCLGDGRSLRTLRSYRPSPPLAIRLVIEAVCLLRNVSCRMEPPPQSLQRPLPPPPSSSGVELAHLHHGERRLTGTLIEMGVVKSGPQNKTSAQIEARGRPRLRPIEAVRHYDQVRDRIVEDYWQTAWRTLNGTHSGQFLADLRRISQGTRIPSQIMALIRRRYLSRREFSLNAIERHSKAAGQLARWLLAVDVFERVMSVVRPNYEEYLEADRALTEALSEVSWRRSQIELIGRELQQNEELIGRQVNERARLVELCEDCRRGSSELTKTRSELIERESKLATKLLRIKAKLRELPGRSLEIGARLIYLDGLSSCERPLIERIVASKLAQASGPLQLVERPSRLIL